MIDDRSLKRVCIYNEDYGRVNYDLAEGFGHSSYGNIYGGFASVNNMVSVES